jgi:hypothetical protein
MVSIIFLYYNRMGPRSYMWSVVDQNIVMQHMTVHVFWIFVFCLWPDQFEFMVVFMVFNLSIGPGFTFDPC